MMSERVNRPPKLRLWRRLHGQWAAATLLTLVCIGLACRPPQAPVSQPPPPPPPIAPPPDVPFPPPPPPPRPYDGPLLVRIGLASDLERFALPASPTVLVRAAGTIVPADQPLEISPWEEVRRRRAFRLQVAALKDETQAGDLAESLTRRGEVLCDSVFDADSDLYKVRCGRFPTRAEAEVFHGRLEVLGVAESWITSEGGAPENPGFEIVRDGVRRVVPGRWLEISHAAEGKAPVAEALNASLSFDGTRYRGKLLLFLNDRGLLNVINEIALETYLRGVVPREMGPALYPQIEALKAQAVAARTYTVLHLDEFDAEGYDLCSTPRCQVYGGMAVEHPLSDRAIAETAHQVVLSEGAPVETFYSATCGGHTENVEVIFPRLSGRHLRGVPCIESGTATLTGDTASGDAFPAGLMRRLLPSSATAAAGPSAASLETRLEHLAILAGLPVPRDRLQTLERREVIRFLTSLYDMALDRRLFTGEADLADLLADPPTSWTSRDLDFAQYLARSGMLQSPDASLDHDAIERLLFRLTTYLGVLERRSTSFQDLSDGVLTVRRDGQSSAHTLPINLATFGPRTPREEGGNALALVGSPLSLMPGDPLDLYWDRGRLVAIVQPRPPRAVRLRANQAPRQRWNAQRSLAEVRDSVQKRYPGFPLASFEILSRGVSGRVGLMRLLGEDGESLLVQGLAVRWTLDLWDTWFEAEPRGDGWRFEGRGWGHGVGMCQAGSYAMATRGHGYREILEHYYSGVELGRVRPQRPRVRASEVLGR